MVLHRDRVVLRNSGGSIDRVVDVKTAGRTTPPAWPGRGSAILGLEC